ncbi:hypothetical protein A9Z06_11975 [Rhizobium sp. YK2]|nr:hypothetical protein A9Z06_11975 [Rhizobium sp. YK2]
MIYHEIARDAVQYPPVQSASILMCFVAVFLTLLFSRRSVIAAYVLVISITVIVLTSTIDFEKYASAIHSTRAVDRIITHVYYPILPPTNSALIAILVALFFRIYLSSTEINIRRYVALLLIVIPIHWLFAIVVYDMYLNP